METAQPDWKQVYKDAENFSKKLCSLENKPLSHIYFLTEFFSIFGLKNALNTKVIYDEKHYANWNNLIGILFVEQEKTECGPKTKFLEKKMQDIEAIGQVKVNEVTILLLVYNFEHIFLCHAGFNKTNFPVCELHKNIQWFTCLIYEIIESKNKAPSTKGDALLTNSAIEHKEMTFIKENVSLADAMYWAFLSSWLGLSPIIWDEPIICAISVISFIICVIFLVKFLSQQNNKQHKSFIYAIWGAVLFLICYTINSTRIYRLSESVFSIKLFIYVTATWAFYVLFNSKKIVIPD